MDNEGTELSIQSIENKGDGVVVVRVNAPPDNVLAELGQNPQQPETEKLGRRAITLFERGRCHPARYSQNCRSLQ